MNKKTAAYTVICALFLLAGFIFGYILPDGKNDVLVNAASLESPAANNYEDLSSEPTESPDTVTEPAPSDMLDAEQASRITASTKMIYEYHYLKDGLTDTIVDTPPYFLIDYTESALREAFVDWLVVSFNDREVLMRKKVDGYSNQYYVVREYEGYVAVYYSSEQNGTLLKEITDSLVSVLPESEQEKLRNGIPVTGNDALNRILEDYGS